MKWYDRNEEWTPIPEEDREYNWAHRMYRLKPDGTGKPRMQQKVHPSKSKMAIKSRSRNRAKR